VNETGTAPLDPGLRLLIDALRVGVSYPLVLAGDHAVLAHGLIHRRARDLEVATESPEPMDRIATTVRAGLERAGWSVHPLKTDPLASRLMVTAPGTDTEYALDLVKETFWRPPAITPLGPALSLEDTVGTKVRALTDRGAARDLVDVHAVADRWSRIELEELGRRHALDAFDLTDLQARLERVEWIDDREFTRCGLDEEAVTEFRQWAQTWADDIAERLLEEEALEPPRDE
jgi:hypothetical protein